MREIVVDPADLAWLSDQQQHDDDRVEPVTVDSRIVVFYYRGRVCAASSMPKFKNNK
jgi:hypothetical protein